MRIWTRRGPYSSVVAKEVGSLTQSRVSWRIDKLLLLLEDVILFSICSRFLLLQCFPPSFMILISNFEQSPLLSTARLLAESSAALVFHYDNFTSDSSAQLCEAAYQCSSGIPVRVFVFASNYKTTRRLYEPPWTAQRWP
jgi:hypothetical protein